MNQVGLILIVWLQIACSSLPTPFKRHSGIILLYLSFVGKLYGGSIQDEKPSGRVWLRQTWSSTSHYSWCAGTRLHRKVKSWRQTKFMFKPVYMSCVISVCLCYILCLMLLLLQDILQEAMGYNRVLFALECYCNWYCCFSFSPCVLGSWCDVMNFVLGTVCLHWHGLCRCKRAVLWQ